MEDPKTGDLKIFPNGAEGKWDGSGWLPTGRKFMPGGITSPSLSTPPPSPPPTASGMKEGTASALSKVLGNRAIMAPAAAIGAGILAAPLTAGMSLPAVLAGDLGAGILGGGTGAGIARGVRGATGQDQTEYGTLPEDIATGAEEGLFTNAIGPTIQGGATLAGRIGKGLGWQGRAALGMLGGAAEAGIAGTPMAGLPAFAATELALNPYIAGKISSVGRAIRPSTMGSGLSRLISFFKAGGEEAEKFTPQELADLAKKGITPEMMKGGKGVSKSIPPPSDEVYEAMAGHPRAPLGSMPGKGVRTGEGDFAAWKARQASGEMEAPPYTPRDPLEWLPDEANLSSLKGIPESATIPPESLGRPLSGLSAAAPPLTPEASTLQSLWREKGLPLHANPEAQKLRDLITNPEAADEIATYSKLYEDALSSGDKAAQKHLGKTLGELQRIGTGGEPFTPSGDMVMTPYPGIPPSKVIMNARIQAALKRSQE